MFCMLKCLGGIISIDTLFWLFFSSLGKSNVMDALGFVMGERAVNLRVKHTRDLIHGAHIGKPVSNSATVTMIYCGDNNEEMTFSRCISGECDWTLLEIYDRTELNHFLFGTIQFLQGNLLSIEWMVNRWLWRSTLESWRRSALWWKRRIVWSIRCFSDKRVNKCCSLYD